jgi:hypothetical protein
MGHYQRSLVLARAEARSRPVLPSGWVPNGTD